MRRKNKQLKKLTKNIFIFTLIFSWIFSGWPNVLENPLFPPKVQEVYAATDTYYGTYDSANSDMTNSSYAETDNTQYAAGDKANEKVVIQSWSGTAGSGVISGVKIYCQHYAASPDGDDFTLVEYSLDNWVSTGTTTGQQVMPGSESSFSVDIYADRAWNWTDIGNLEVRATAKADGKSNFGTDYIDVLYIQVDYTITTTLGDSTDPGPSTVAPGSTDNYLDQFSFVASSGADTVTALTVTTTNTTAVASVEIWNDALSTQYFSTDSTPNGDAWEFSSGTEIPVTDSTVNFRVIFDAKSHAALAAGTYGVTGTVTAYTCTNSKVGSDTDSATITVDNLSPSGATSTSGSAGNAQVTLDWTTSDSSDFNTTSGSVIYRWAAGSVGSEVPDEGSTPGIGSTNGTATAACVVSSAASAPLSKIDGSGGSAECTTAALTNGQAYSYKVFQKDLRGNYDAGVTFTSSPFTPSANSPPSISISQPDGVSDTVVVGTSYDITYTLSDSDDIVTAAFYYDDDNTGLNGVAITGPCAAAAEGSGVTCAWNTTGMTPGSYYVYGIADDGTNPAENAYSSGQITINAQSLTFSISNSAIDFGTLSATAARFATTNASSGGSSTESIAHTLAASTNVSGGYIITVKGATLTHTINGSFAVDAITSTAVNVTLGGSVGTEQFGLRLTKSGTGSVTSPYDGAANFYVYDGTASSASQIASGAGDGTSTTFSVYSAANIAANTEAGTYETALTYICTAAF